LFGWYLILMLVLVVLVFWERKSSGRRLSELEARLRQVEELLLEICALMEEEETTIESPASAQQETENSKAPGRENPQPVGQTPPPIASGPVEVAVTASGQPQSPSVQPKPKTPPKKEVKKESKHKVKREKLPQWNQQIIQLWQQGLPVPEIARQTGKGQGEVQLIIDLYCKERPEK
jgi:FtsZ-interacting cell division protein ZipA